MSKHARSARAALWRVSAALALISGKPPQIRPANSASLSLIVAKEDSDSEGKGKHSRATPFGSADANLSYRTIESSPFIFYLFFLSSFFFSSPLRRAEGTRIHHQLFCRPSDISALLPVGSVRKGKFRGTSRNAGRMEAVGNA